MFSHKKSQTTETTMLRPISEISFTILEPVCFLSESRLLLTSYKAYFWRAPLQKTDPF